MYRIVKDNDGHGYVIPVARTEEFFLWENSTEAEDGIVPEWADPINGSTLLVTFPSYVIR